MWNLKDLPGQSELRLNLQFNVPTIRNSNWIFILIIIFILLIILIIFTGDCDKHLKKPIIVKFEIPSFTVSGIQVRYLKIQEKSNYQAFPYVKYLTMNGEYHIRMV